MIPATAPAERSEEGLSSPAITAEPLIPLLDDSTGTVVDEDGYVGPETGPLDTAAVGPDESSPPLDVVAAVGPDESGPPLDVVAAVDPDESGPPLDTTGPESIPLDDQTVLAERDAVDDPTIGSGDAGGSGIGTTTASSLAVPVMVVLSSVTTPYRAIRRPSTADEAAAVIEVNAIRLPIRTELLPRLADVPTCQKTLLALAIPARTTREKLPVVKMSVINIQISAAFTALSVTVLDAERVKPPDPDRYTPAPNVTPPNSESISRALPTAREETSCWYARLAEARAVTTTWILPVYTEPVTHIPGGKPVTEFEVNAPTDRADTLSPKLETPNSARTLKLDAKLREN